MDFPHFSSFMKSMSNEFFETCSDMIRDNCDLYFTFSKEEISRAKKDVKLNSALWAKKLSRNRNNHTVNYSAEYPTLSMISSLQAEKKFAALTSIYLVSGKDKEEFILNESIGKEITLLRQFAIDGKNIPTKKYTTRHMTDWKVIRDNTLPCSDIIIADQFLFSQEDVLYERNAYQLLQDLCSKVTNKRVNIVFFTMGKMKVPDFDHIYKDGRCKEKWVAIPMLSITRNIKEKLQDKFEIDANITFVSFDKMEHDRTIFTNFKLFDSGDSFKYFRNNEESSSNGRWVHVNTLIDEGIYDLSKEFIVDMQKIIDLHKYTLNDIWGDKKSNFLNFDKPVQLNCTDND